MLLLSFPTLSNIWAATPGASVRSLGPHMIRLGYQHMVQPVELMCGQSSAHLLGSMSQCCSEDLQGRRQSCTGAATLATGNASPENSEVAADSNCRSASATSSGSMASCWQCYRHTP